jgi:hypothetical protein
MQLLKPVHIAVGVVGLLAFALTGQYMAIFLKGLAETPDGPRLLYRSAHLYLMWASLLNLVVGLYFTVATGKGARIAQGIGSAMLLATPPLFLTGFFGESPTNDLVRPFSSAANYLALLGTLLHVATSGALQRQRAPQA